MIGQLNGCAGLIIPVGGYAGQRVMALLNQKPFQSHFVSVAQETRICSTLLNMSIGSGDAFAAGIALAFLQKNDMLFAVQFGMACAGANVLTALAGQIHEYDVNQLLPQVTYQQI